MGRDGIVIGVRRNNDILDPTHVSFYIDTTIRFQSMRLFTTDKDSNQVCWVEGHFVALKGNRPPGGIKI